MDSKKLFLILVLASVLILGCDRKERPYGGGREILGAPEYTANEEVSMVTGVAFVEEIAPKLAGDGVLDGAALYMKSCGACHQANGVGIPAVFPPLDKSPYVIGENVERLAAIMVYGLVGPIKVLGTTYSSAMAGVGAQFNDAELAAIATYIRTSWSNSDSPVDASTFAAVRQKWGSRGPFAIQELGEES